MKKGVTLVELIVALFISSILLISLSTGFAFINKTQRTTMDNSKSNYVLTGLKDYIQENADTIIEYKYANTSDYFSFDETEKTLSHNNEVIFEQLPFSSLKFVFFHEGMFEKCTIKYTLKGEEKDLTFIIGDYNLDDIVSEIVRRGIIESKLTNLSDYNIDSGILTIENKEIAYNLPFNNKNELVISSVVVTTESTYKYYCTIVYYVNGARYVKQFGYGSK